MRRILACLLACLVLLGPVLPCRAMAKAVYVPLSTAPREPAAEETEETAAPETLPPDETGEMATEGIVEETQAHARNTAEAVSLEVTRQPDKTEYRPGECFDPAGMEAVVLFSDGSQETVTGQAIAFDAFALMADDTMVTVSYGEAAADVDITVTATLEGAGTKESPYLLTNEEDVRLLDDWVTQGDQRAKGCFRMTGNIVLTGEWEGIGDESTPFTGDFDGGGYQITIPEGGKALFARTRGAVVHDLKLYGPQIEDYGLVSVYTVDRKEKYYVQFLRVTLVSGTRTQKAGFLGGYASGNDRVLIEDCTIESGVTVGYGEDESHIGSFAGEFNGTIRNSHSAAAVYGVDWVGGLVGNKGQSMGDFVVEGSSFSGEVYATGNYVGGIVGGGYGGTGWGLETAPNSKGVVIRDCQCDGFISGGNGVGGILGAEACIQQFWENGIGTVQNNRFTGYVRGTGSYVGGIIGYMQSLNVYMVIKNNYYTHASTGIGAVAHIDTNAIPNGYGDEGTYYYDTSKYTGIYDPKTGNDTREFIQEINYVALKVHMELDSIGEPGSEYVPVVKFDLNRDDDPLGVDKNKLCYTDEVVENYITDLELDGECKTEYIQGEDLDLDGLTLTAFWSSGDTTLVDLDKVTVSGFDTNTLGEQTVRLRYDGFVQFLTVTVRAKVTGITVSVTVLGDGHHSDPLSNGGPHGLARGGLVTWAEDSDVPAREGQTVWDVLKPLLDDEGLSYDTRDSSEYNSVYIAGINGLGEFDNGSNSGWMYTVNGDYPNRGVSAWYVHDKDEIVLHYTDDYTYEKGNKNYGKPVERTGPDKVIELIEQIGDVVYTDFCRDRIVAARRAYDALSKDEQKKVTNYAKLTAAEKIYVEPVEELIAAIGKVTVNSGEDIDAAWNAYNALPGELKSVVTKLSALQTAEREWNQLMAQQVVAMIEKFSQTITEKDLTAVEAARKAYDALTETQKRLVTNLNKLMQAETALAWLTATEEDKEKARAVAALIEKLTNVTLDSEKEIAAAREAYEKLTDLQKKLVENIGLLETAETKLSVLKSMGKVSAPYIATGDYMEALGTPGVGPIGGEWMVIGLARSDRQVPGVDAYYQKALEYITGSIDGATGRLHKAKSTDNSRMILALTAIGKDVTNVGGFNLLQGLSDLEYVKYQGNNGPIWALLALNSGNYPVFTGATATRQALVEELLRVQTADGGWAISGDRADSDMTGMALQALAPYRETDARVQAAVDRALARLSEMQDPDGGFSTSYGDDQMVATSESISQVVTALAALGIDPDTDPRFIKSGGSAIDALLRYFVEGGGFRHVSDGERDGMATEQAYYALTAYYRLLAGKTSLYDMTDVINMGGDLEEAAAEPTSSESADREPEQKKAGFPWGTVVGCMLGSYALGVGTVTLVVPRIKKRR